MPAVMLALDTAGPWVAVCAGSDPDLLVTRRVTARLNHNELLLGLVDEVRGGSGLDAVAVNVGPGSFTGTRVGVAFATGLAQGLGVPAAPYSAFEIIADVCPPTVHRVAVAVPVVRDIWCRARLRRAAGGWDEESVEELTASELGTGLAGIQLLRPWNASGERLDAPADWDAATALWHAAARGGPRRQRAPAQVRVRYAGPSQAERTFHARQKRS